MSTTRIAICLFLSFLPPARAGECRTVLGVEDVVKHAATLDGKVVCVRGIEFPSQVPEWDTVLYNDLVPIPNKKQPKPSGDNKIGLVQWSPEAGIDEKYYKPDSFDLFLEGKPKDSKITNPFEVILRAAVAYKQHLRSQSPRVTPPAPSIDKMLAEPYDIELIVLEVVRAKSFRQTNVGSEAR